MNVYQYVLVLFLLFTVTAQASSKSSEREEEETFNLKEMRRQLEGIQQREIQEGNLGEEPAKANKQSTSDLSSNINPNSTLKEVDHELEGFRKELYKANPDAELADVNNHALAALDIAGYLENDLLSKVDKAIKKKCYAFLKSLYPATMMIWWNDDELALLLAKAYGRAEWMSKDEWEKHGRTVNWKLRFRSLIRSGNENVYGDEEFRDLIFKNEIFRRNFKMFIQEAYDSGNTAFLKAVPYPSEDFPLGIPNAVFFWSLTYGQEWCSSEWTGYINTVEDIDEALMALNIFECDNPSVFEHERVKAFLKDQGIKEELETAIEWDSLSFAQYLKAKLGEEDFKRMVKNCSKVHTEKKEFSLRGRSPYNRYAEERLSRVYNFLLENEKKLDANDIQFRDVPMLEGKHLLPLLRSGFNRVPVFGRDFDLYGTTETGIKFLEMILKEEYKVDGKVWKEWEEWKEWRAYKEGRVEKWGEVGTWKEAWSEALSNVELDTLDIESFKLINENLCAIAAGENPAIDDEAKKDISRNRELFYQQCMIFAIWKGDIKFIIDAIIPTFTATKKDDFTFDSIFLNVMICVYPIEEVLIEAAKGNFAILDWILDFKPELLEKIKSIHSLASRNSPRYAPFLKYLFEQSKEKGLPSYKFLAKYAEIHLEEAANTGNLIHYDEVRGIEGVAEAMKEHGYKIPEFPGRG